MCQTLKIDMSVAQCVTELSFDCGEMHQQLIIHNSNDSMVTLKFSVDGGVSGEVDVMTLGYDKSDGCPGLVIVGVCSPDTFDRVSVNVHNQNSSEPVVPDMRLIVVGTPDHLANRSGMVSVDYLPIGCSCDNVSIQY